MNETITLKKVSLSLECNLDRTNFTQKFLIRENEDLLKAF